MPTRSASRLIASLVLASVAALWPLFAAAPAATLSTTEINMVEAPDPRIPEVRLLFALYSGSAADPPGREGVAWLTAAAIRIEAGAGLDAIVDRDITLFSATATRDAAARLIETVARALIRPPAGEAVLEHARSEQKAALAALRADPVRLCREAFDAFVYRGHPYEHPPVGLESAIARITSDDLLAFHTEHYRKGNLVVGLHGAVDDRLTASVKSQLDALADGVPVRSERPVTWLARPRALIVQSTGASTLSILLGHPLNVTPAHPDYLDLMLPVSHLIGPHVENLPRRQEFLALPVEDGPDEAPAEAIQRIVADLRALASSGIDAGTLEDSRRAYLVEWTAGMGDPGQLLRWRLADHLHRSPGFHERLAASLAGISVPSAASALARHLHPDGVAVVVVTADAAEASRRLLRPGTAGRPGPAAARILTADDFEVVKAEDLFR